MNDIDQKAFVKTTLDTYKNKNLERAFEISQKRADELKSFTSNDNRVILFIAWSFTMIIMFCIIPLFITGFFTKGATLSNQSTYWIAIFLSISIASLGPNIL